MSLTNGKAAAHHGQNLALINAALTETDAYNDMRGTLDNWIRRSHRTGKHFTAEHIRADMTPETVAYMDTHPNVFPAMIARASQTGRIQPIGRRTTTRRARHGGDNRIWTARKEEHRAG